MLSLECNQTRLRGGQRLSRRELQRVARVVVAGIGRKRKTHVSVAFVSSTDIRRLNRVYRGKYYVADVLAFTLPRGESAGEVLICYEKARKQAKEEGHATKTEVFILLVHGLLHVFGEDHETRRDAKRMFSLQTRMLGRLGIDWHPVTNIRNRVPESGTGFRSSGSAK